VKFHRAISPPDSVDATKVAAALDTGVLKVTLPKQELAQPRTVKVEIGQTNGPIASGRGDPPLVDHSSRPISPWAWTPAAPATRA
jgi:hypothetical protein